MTTRPTHLMLDLETWGTTPGSDLRSIGAVVFDPVAGTLGDEFYVNVENPQRTWNDGGYCESGYWNDKPKYPLTRNPETVQWWSEQSPEAQAALLVDQRPIDDGLVQFACWLDVLTGENLAAGGDGVVRIWAHGSTFDVPVLAAAYTAVFPGRELPWHYRAPRDTRTIFEAAGGVEIPTSGTYHHALHDAKNQALAVISAYRKLREPAIWQCIEIVERHNSGCVTPASSDLRKLVSA